MAFELITDRSEASSGFNPEDRFIRVSGELVDVAIVPNKNMTRARVDLHLNPVTEVLRAGERQTDPADFQNGIHVSFDYGQWDAVNRSAKGPRPDDVWFEAIVPAFEAAGFDTSNLGEELLGLIGEELTFEEATIERTNSRGNTYEVIERGEDRRVLPPLNADDPDVSYDEEAGRWSDNAVFNKVTATYTSLLPVARIAASLAV